MVLSLATECCASLVTSVLLPVAVVVAVHMALPWHLWIDAVDSWRRRGWHDAALFSVATNVLHCTLYFGVNFFFLALDRWGLLASRKLPRLPAQVPSPALVRATIVEGTVSHAVLGWPFGVALFFVFQACGSKLDGPLPLWTVVASQVRLRGDVAAPSHLPL
jgi:hypothetical protein